MRNALILQMVLIIGMVNLIAGRQVATELIQNMVSPETITREVLTLLRDPEKLAQIKEELRIVHQKLGEPGAPDRAAKVIVDILNK